MKEAFVDLQNITNKIAAFVRYENEQLLAKYPPDIPNISGHHAFIKGISIENSFNPCVGEYNFLFETSYEKMYIWTHTANENSALISDIWIFRSTETAKLTKLNSGIAGSELHNRVS